MLKTARVEILKDAGSWDNFRKQAKILPVQDDAKKEAVDKEADFQVVATIDPEKFIYIHTTIMAGVKTEENGFWITSESEKFINDNNDAWTCDDLLKDYKSFKRATTFVEHDQRLENAKGKCIDVIARDMGDTILIDVLFSVDRRHKDLVANIENGIINAVSMGCTTAQTICTICGNVANDPNTYCDHLKPGNKGRSFRSSDGNTRRAAELCKSNTFFDVSLVANPAFAGAVFRKILSTLEVSNHLLANILNSKIEAMYKDDGMLLKAASKENDVANITIKQNGSIEIKTPNQTFTASESLSKEEIEKIGEFLPNQEQQKQSNLLERVLEKIFGGTNKKATHPIQNETNKKDFSITDSDYSDIPYRNPHKILDDANLGINTNSPVLELNLPPTAIILEINPSSLKEIIQRVQQFECCKCGFKADLWNVKAASIDAGQHNLLECPRCFFVAEETLYKTAAKNKFKVNEKVTITTKKDKDEAGEIVAIRGNLYIVKLENGKTVWKSEEDLLKQEQKKSSIFIATQDIPVDNDEGTYWFDEQGNSAITKGEKVSFVTTVENGEYGLFITETGEDFFMPMSHVNSIIKQN
jgi:hypothetical protein